MDTSSRPRSSRTKRSSAIVSPMSPNIEPKIEIYDRRTGARLVRIRFVFIHIGEIDTLNEKYQADIYYEARWLERCVNLTTLNLTPAQQTRLIQENRSVKINDLSSTSLWLPELFIENAIGQIGNQEKWFTLQVQSSKTSNFSSLILADVDVCEHRRFKGIFWEKLELNHFPADVQDLTISITSHHSVDTCLLIQDERFRSSINREAFVDQQKWSLYQHVGTEMRETQEEYSFEDDNKANGPRKHPVLSVTCRAARRPGFYYWNAFYLIFLITASSFCIFSITPNLPQNRLQITCTLLLTSVTFRWVVNRSLPAVYYLTTLDIYAIISIMVLIVLCIWHSVIAAIMFYNSTEPITSSNFYVIVDRYVMIGMLIVYVIVHILLLIWLIFVPYKRRREMEYLDRQYAANKIIQLVSDQSGYGSTAFISGPLPSTKPTYRIKTPENVMVLPDVASFFPATDHRDNSMDKRTDVFDPYQEENQANETNLDERQSTPVVYLDSV